MKIGSTVRFTDAFLSDIGTRSNDALRYAVGTITELDGIGEQAIATVRWNSSRMPRYNATKHLVAVD